MSLDYAILGFLKNSPKTGYDLQKKIEKSINHFWTSTQSQIYRTLNRMEEDKLIVSEIHYQAEKPNKKVYSITEKGNDALIAWLSSPITIPNHRNPFLVQLFFSGSIDKETIKSNLLHYKEELHQRLEFLKSDETKKLVEYATGKIELFLYRSILTNGINVLEAEIDWVDTSVQEIDTM